jgi:hypothetical protein
VRRALVALGLAVLGGVAVGVTIATDERTHWARIRECNATGHITVPLPGYAVPLSIVAAVLFLAAVVVAATGSRRGFAFAVLVLAVLGLLFTLWLGVYATIDDAPVPRHACFGSAAALGA